MFGFEKLEVYKIAQQQYIKQLEVLHSLDKKNLPQELTQALSVATLSIIQNFSQGSSKVDAHSKKKYYTESRTAVFEAVALLKIIREINPVGMNEDDYNFLYNGYESLSRMMLSLIRNISNIPNNNKRNDQRRKNSFSDSEDSNGNGFAEVDSSSDEDDFTDFNKLNIGE